MAADDQRADEAVLREAVLRGSEAAWRALYDRYFDALYGYVRWRLRGDAARADDVVQECWVTAVRRIGDFDPSRALFGTWLRGIADHTMRNDVRKVGRREIVESRLDESMEAQPAVQASTLTSECVSVALGALPEHYRDIICAKYRDGMSVAEIADGRGLSPKAIESLLTRARNAFRREYRRLQEET